MAGQDARGVRINLGVPGQRPAEGGLHAQVQPSVPRAERPDERRVHDGGPHVTAPARSGSKQQPPVERWRELRREAGPRSWTGCGRPGAAGTEATPLPPQRKGSRGVPEGRVRQTERVTYHQRCRFARIHRVGLVAQVLGSLKEGELVRHRAERGSHLPGGLHSDGEAHDDPGRVIVQVRRRGAEEDLVAQGGDPLAEFRDLLGDRHAVRSAERISGDRELAA